MREREPWSIHPDLTSDRLIAIGQLILQGRNDALDRHDPDVGADPWTLGCNAFQYQRFQISKAVTDGSFPWLSIIDPSMQFVFRIGAVPMRFYRGEADDPTPRTLRQSFPELRQFSLFPKGTEARDYTHRLAVETDIDGAVTSIKYVATNGDTPEFFWDIPLTASVAPIRPVDENPAGGVELPPPTVELPGEEDEASEQPVEP
jgi:hypothetical protein